MDHEITVLFVSNRAGRVEVVYYCPVCEAINELVERDTRLLVCRECRSFLTAERATLEVVHEKE